MTRSSLEVRAESPFPFEALPRVWRWIEPFWQKVADDFAPQNLTDFVSHMAATWDRRKTWAVYGDDELGGLILFERLSPWLGTAHVLLKPDFHGRGIAVKACRMAVGEMFQENGIGKLEFHVLAGNLAIGSLLANIGAKREGTLFGQTLRSGEPTDVWAYGLSKRSFEEKHHELFTVGKPADNDHNEPRDQLVDREHLRVKQQHADVLA